MKTEHYIVENIAEFSEHTEAIKKLKVYLNYIEGIFPVIEEIFGQKWEDNHIYIILNNSESGASYGRPSGIHTISMGIWNKAIQVKKYPKNLWGCLLHETLHAFMNPIVRFKDGSVKNGLDEYYWDKHRKEPFVFAFQALLYLRLEKKGIIDKPLCEKFLLKLEKELFIESVLDLYKRYLDMFKINATNFSKFIKRLNESSTPLIKKHTFWEDLDKAEEALKS